MPKANINQAPAKLYFNRELSWLKFNQRVLEEAMNEAHPLLERLRFLSISASNLDEFYMVRYAGLREQKRAGITRKSQDGLTPAEQLVKIEADAVALMLEQQECWGKLRGELEAEGIEIIGPDGLDKADMKWLAKTFEESIFPILTPLAVDPAHPFPFIPNRGFALALMLEPKGEGEQMTGLVPLPAFASRFVKLPPGKRKKQTRFIALERVIPLFIDMLFPGYIEKKRCLFRIVRDSDIEIDDEAEDLIREFEILLRQRRRGRIVRIKVSADAPEDLRDLILRELETEPHDLVLTDSMIGMAQLSELITPEFEHLQFPTYEPRYPERIREHSGDCFAAIKQKDILVHHPYESFDVVVEFIKQAASDPNVIAIKQTLYRTSANSPVVAALIEAAEAGKSVTALVEIKARFDEEVNLRLARDLERSGVQVVYGFIDYKTHAKVSLVVRREEDGLRTYTHFGTGNYHPITARIYTDLSLFTADPAMARDAGRLFNFVTGYKEPPQIGPPMEKIHMSPIAMSQALLDLINAERDAAKAGQPSGIWAKMNSLVDADIIDALYAASKAGVPIQLIVRGICCLRPGVKGLSETIEVKSIVGRFLEHSRIVAFANGAALPSRQAKVFMSSADWMPRNLKRRVEALLPIENATVHRQVLNQVLLANLNDNKQSWYLQSDGSYVRVQRGKGVKPFDAHQYFMHNSSLSGRGSVTEFDAPPILRTKKATPK
jgi:polyphosphate kinase